MSIIDDEEELKDYGLIEIDGCNVAECGFYHPEYDEYCHIALAFSEDYGECISCKDNPNCYFKQLQRLKAENEMLNKMTGIYSARKCKQYKTALEEIKSIASKTIIENPVSVAILVSVIRSKVDEVLND